MRTAGAGSADETLQRPLGLLVTAVIIGCVSGYAAIRTTAAIRSFEEMFEGFGADLPDITRLVLAMPYLWYLFAAIGIPLATWILARPRVGRAELANMKLAARLFIIVFALAFGVTAYALYMPLFELGAVV